MAEDDKIRLAREWGLRFTRDTPNHDGWCDCRAIDRTDRNRSAGFNARTGVYRDASTGQVLSLFDLGVALGAFSNWTEAVVWCAEHFKIGGTGGARASGA
jgi:hypothetical protein